MSGFKETADGYSYEIYGGGRIYCNWQKEYKNYCERRQTYIKRITPIYNFLKANKNKSYLLEELRQELNDNTIKSSTMLSLLKNNIVKRALNANGEAGLDSVLEGPTAIVMSEEDYVEPLKAIYKFSKDNDFYKIKGGIVEGKVMSVEELITLAKLPSREELLSMLAGGLLANISKLAVGLDQVRIQ